MELTEVEKIKKTTEQLATLVFTDFEKGDCQIKKIRRYEGKLPRVGHAWYGIDYVYKGTGQIIYQGAYEMNRTVEKKLIAAGKLYSYLLTKVTNTLRDAEFTDEEIAGMQLQAAAMLNK